MLNQGSPSDHTGNHAPSWFRQALDHPGQGAHVMANGASIHYLGWNLDDTSKPVLLLLHGFRSHAHWWDWTAPYLASGYRIVAPDLSGMGDSAHRENYAADTFAEDVIAFLEATQLSPVTAVGHSYGGSTLLRACANRPELFSRLILLDTSLTFGEDAHAPKTPPRVLSNASYPNLETAIARFVLRPRQPTSLPYLLQHIARHSARQHEDGWRWKFDPAVYPHDKDRCDSELLLSRVKCPVEYVRAGNSSVVSPARARTIAQFLRHPDSHGMIEIPDTHHHMMIDQPIALIAVLRTLLSITV